MLKILSTELLSRTPPAPKKYPRRTESHLQLYVELKGAQNRSYGQYKYSG